MGKIILHGRHEKEMWQSQVKYEFEKLIEKSVGENGRYIIFIDDLDRVKPNKTIDIIEAIKTFLDCKKCVFIIGCDYNYLNACIRKKYGDLTFNPRDYIEKIVQVTFQVSALNEHLLNIYLSKNITPFIKTRDDFDIASNLIHKSLGRNPRKIKRLTNSYSIVHNLNDNGLDNCLLLKLICFMQRWPDIYKEALANFNDGNYSFKEYQDWALPMKSFHEFTGYDPSWEYDEYEDGFKVNYIEPPSESQHYEEYKNRVNKIKTVISEEFDGTNKNNPEANRLKVFLQAPPLFPDELTEFAPYVSLVQSIDLGAVRSIEIEVLNAIPSFKDTYYLFVKVEQLFDGQEVDGKYFESEYKVVLPKKGSIENLSRYRSKNQMRGSLGNWFYIILDSKGDDATILSTIENIEDFKIKKYNALWIISPWGFSKHIRTIATEKPNIYLSSYSSLLDLYWFLLKDWF